MVNNQFAGIKKDLENRLNDLNKTMSQLVGGDIENKLKDIMYNANAEQEKKVNIKKMPARMILTKTGEVVIIFDDKNNSNVFFESIK